MVDKEGFRPNVGILVSDGVGRLLWAKRIGQDAWQFPQGGIDRGESPVDAMYRELFEEVGLERTDVSLVAQTQGWLRYRLPKPMQRRQGSTRCVGQKQKWFLLKLLSDQRRVRLDLNNKPEFDHWEWVNYWYPVDKVVEFKRGVYRRALKELAPFQCAMERS